MDFIKSCYKYSLVLLFSMGVSLIAFDAHATRTKNPVSSKRKTSTQAAVKESEDKPDSSETHSSDRDDSEPEEDQPRFRAKRRRNLSPNPGGSSVVDEDEIDQNFDDEEGTFNPDVVMYSISADESKEDPKTINDLDPYCLSWIADLLPWNELNRFGTVCRKFHKISSSHVVRNHCSERDIESRLGTFHSIPLPETKYELQKLIGPEYWNRIDDILDIQVAETPVTSSHWLFLMGSLWPSPIDFAAPQDSPLDPVPQVHRKSPSGFQYYFPQVFPSNYQQDKPNLPATGFSYSDIVWFIRKLRILTQDSEYSYGLPNHELGTYFMRAGTKTRFPWGDTEEGIEDYVWYERNSSQKAQPVGLKNPNPWNLFDTIGNIWEWRSPSDHSSHPGFQGGSFNNALDQLSPTILVRDSLYTRFGNRGFRLIRIKMRPSPQGSLEDPFHRR